MVIGGPLLVVIASLVTVSIAVRHPDPVLPREAAPAVVTQPGDASPEERLRAEKALLPASQARNHAASSSLPKND